MNIHYPKEMFSTGNALTILVHRSVSRDEEQKFVEVLQARLGEFSRISGTLGSHVFRHELGDQVEFSILQSFSDETAHQAWRKSPGFERWLREVAPEKPEPGHLRRYSGMEALFVPAKTPGAPLRCKMAFLMLAAVFPFSLAINLWFAPVLARMSAMIGSFVSVLLTPARQDEGGVGRMGTWKMNPVFAVIGLQRNARKFLRSTTKAG